MNSLEKQSFLLIRRGVCCSRAELARRLQISRPTASVAVESLLAQEFVLENGTFKTPRGKSPTLVQPNPERLFTIGFDVGYASRIAGVLVDGSGTIREKSEVDFNRKSLSDIQNKLLELFRRLSAGHSIQGCGIALPAVISVQTGKVLKSVNPLLCSVDLAAWLSEQIHLPVIQENRSRLAAYSEAFGGAAHLEKNFLLLSLGNSIGASFWLNGSLYSGTHSAAGEIRNLRLRSGCTLEEALAPGVKMDSAALENCADGLSTILDMMDVELIILAGRFSDFDKTFPDRLENALHAEHPCLVRTTLFGRFSAARGAANKIAEKIL